ncbi:Hypothetical protein A7982_04642 [Minicystis rosea]|nr:Hypothetical protein A7982_04642 [Minicystis rosea]
MENCTNGIDDDGNGLVDCADPACTVLFTCAPPVPPGGWVGPLAFWMGSGSATPPDCEEAGGFPTEMTNGGTNPTGVAPTCPSCSCSSPVGVACQIAQAQFFGSPGCAPPGSALTIAQGVCQGFVTLSFDPASVRWGTAPAAGGACLPQASGFPVIPPVHWDTQIRACGDAGNGAGCGMGACVPKPSPPFEDMLCIYRDGNVPCPAGPYSVRQVFFADADDTRQCSSCQCGTPSGTSCVGTMKLYTDTQCTTEETLLTSVSQCSALPPDPTTPPPPYLSQRSIIYTGTPSGSGSCPSTPSSASGAVTPEDPITVCCTP